jgi:AraC-like DNA-binding protein
MYMAPKNQVAELRAGDTLPTMEVVPPSGQPCYSARLLAPFMAVLRGDTRISKAAFEMFEALDAEERVRVSAVHSMLEAAVSITKDEFLGVKASRHVSHGDAGILDFVMSSAATLRAAIESARRYIRLINDTLDFAVELDDDAALVKLECRVVLPPAAEDFQICSLIASQAPVWPEGLLEELDVWFRHAPPSDPQPYHDVLGPVRLHFHAPLSGFGFPARFLDAPLKSSDTKLHELLRRYADSSLAALPQPESVTEKVRRLIVEQLASGEFSLEEAARRLRMSSRTLGRRLSEEGTTFKSLVDDTRKRIALRYVAGHDLGLAEVALLSGFTETPSFYRAFRRWTGMTPSKYRWTHRGDLRGLR